MTISITPEGLVIKDGEEIGSIAGDVCALHKKPGPTVYKAIKDAAGRDLKFDIAPMNAPAAPVITVPLANPPPLSDDELLSLAKARGLISTEAPAPARHVNIDPTTIVLPKVAEGRQALNNLLKRAEAGEIPPCPVDLLTAPLGDKTPEVVAWVKHYGTPEQYKEQYDGRKIGNPNEKPKTWMKNELADNDD